MGMEIKSVVRPTVTDMIHTLRSYYPKVHVPYCDIDPNINSAYREMDDPEKLQNFIESTLTDNYNLSKEQKKEIHYALSFILETAKTVHDTKLTKAINALNGNIDLFRLPAQKEPSFWSWFLGS